jgi:6-phosphofructokinase 1
MSQEAAFYEEPAFVLWSSERGLLETALRTGQPLPYFEGAGPRDRLFFDPANLGAGLVTCGGLCPGLNDVIASITRCLWEEYGVRRIYGFRYGYSGLVAESGHSPLPLDPDTVRPIHHWGGTILGSSRGPQNVSRMVDELVRRQLSLLFVIGGDGTLRGGAALCEEIARRGLSIAVVGVPKTIDNDLEWIDRSFGFSSAVDEARRAVHAAHTEATGAWNGVALVKLMGRHSGFIAAHACLADSDADFCLIPEVAFALEGPRGFLEALRRRLERRHHAVIVAAEGAGQEHLPRTGAVDASGNEKLADIGTFLRDHVRDAFSQSGSPVAVRYIDPSYILRGLPANAIDSELCLQLGQAAVHAGMAGRTNLIVGHWNQHFVHIPIALAVGGRRRVDPDGELWRSVLASTGQPATMSTE